MKGTKSEEGKKGTSKKGKRKSERGKLGQIRSRKLKKGGGRENFSRANNIAKKRRMVTSEELVAMGLGGHCWV